jgi:hypothetical protein
MFKSNFDLENLFDGFKMLQMMGKNSSFSGENKLSMGNQKMRRLNGKLIWI